MKSSTAILLALLGVGVYLLWKSLANIQSSLGQVGTTLNGELSSLNSGASTLYHEAGAVGSSLLSPISALSSIGTSAYNGVSSFFGTSSPSIANLSSDLGTNSIFMGQGTPIGNLGDNSLFASGDPLSQGLIPVSGGTLDLHLGGGLTAANSDGSYGDLFGSLTDSSPGDGFLPQDNEDADYLDFLGGL